MNFQEMSPQHCKPREVLSLDLHEGPWEYVIGVSGALGQGTSAGS